MFSLESILMSTHNIPFSNYHKTAELGFFQGFFKNEFKTAVVNEPAVFKPLKVYCNKG